MLAYHEIFFRCAEELKDTVGAELAELGYEGFWEHDDGVSAYIPADRFDREAVTAVFGEYQVDGWELREIEPVNWNSEWEKNYEPVVVGNDVYVRAPFHPSKPGVKHELVIQPKMSFGTGHHETTRLVIRQMLEIDFSGKLVLDMGCGTGILGILASRMGAAKVYAIDHEEWAYLNTVENARENQVTNLVALHGGKEQIPAEHFDIILSNITKNINLELLPLYTERLKPGGTLVVSGFYESDLEEIKAAALSFKLQCILVKKDNNWVSARFNLNI